MASTHSKTGFLATSLMRTAGAAVLLFALTGCEAQFSISTAKLSEGKMASAINAETRAPATLASTFRSDAPAIQAGGSRNVAFTLSAPVTGWPAGQYETRFYLNGKEIQRQPFNVAAAPAPPSPSSPSAASPSAGTPDTSRPSPEPPAQRPASSQKYLAVFQNLIGTFRFIS